MAVGGGTKVSDKEFATSTELLMRQLLKLDGIKADGEAKMQRKAEVCLFQHCWFLMAELPDILFVLMANNALCVAHHTYFTIIVLAKYFTCGMSFMHPLVGCAMC